MRKMLFFFNENMFGKLLGFSGIHENKSLFIYLFLRRNLFEDFFEIFLF